MMIEKSVLAPILDPSEGDTPSTLGSVSSGTAVAKETLDFSDSFPASSTAVT